MLTLENIGKIKDAAFYQFKNDLGMIAKEIKIDMPYVSILSENDSWYYYKLTSSFRIKKSSLRKDI